MIPLNVHRHHPAAMRENCFAVAWAYAQTLSRYRRRRRTSPPQCVPEPNSPENFADKIVGLPRRYAFGYEVRVNGQTKHRLRIASRFRTPVGYVS
jgi:hypothetical protein